jgi:hypothetical protein
MGCNWDVKNQIDSLLFEDLTISPSSPLRMVRKKSVIFDTQQCYIPETQFTCFHKDDYSKTLRDERHSILNKVSLIPKSDLEMIKDLFNHLFKFNELSFTLYGDKPISFYNPFHYIPFYLSKQSNLFWYVERVLEKEKSYHIEWNVWKKYEKLFPIDNFILIKEDFGVVLVNKRETVKAILNNIDLFFDVLGENFSIYKIFKELESGRSLFNLLNKNHALLGILLGFGRHNSELFQRREEILSILEPYSIPTQLNCIVSQSSSYKTMQQELDDLWKKLNMLHDSDKFFPIVNLNRVLFAADLEHPETIFLKKKYEILRKKIEKIYSKKDWFEQTLIQLTSD